MQTAQALREWITGSARELGFARIGFAPISTPTPTFEAFEQWLSDRFDGTMAYLPRGRNRRRDASLLLPHARSIISVAVSCYVAPVPPQIAHDPSRGRIAAYARGADYHNTMTPLLEQLCEQIAMRTGAQCKPYVDTGALLERAYAAQSQLGFIGKNTCLIDPHAGSHFMLGEIITTHPLFDQYETLQPAPMPACGTCQRCLEQCPTHAFAAPYRLNANRCISYLTIEYKGDIDSELAAKMKNWIFGCDICQEVCPWNRFAAPEQLLALSDDWEQWAPPLLSLIELTPAQFEERFHSTPLARTGRDRLLRNVSIALRNCGSPEAINGLQLLTTDASPIVSNAATKALNRSST